jgi:hypothetical protein
MTSASAIALFLSALLPANLASGEPPRTVPIYTLRIRVDRASGWLWKEFECVENVPYFDGERKRQADETLKARTWKSLEQAIYFGIPSLTDATTIKSLGPGGIVEKNDLFSPTKLPAADKSRPGYLTADYSTDPPSVKLAAAPTEFSRWKFTPAERKGAYYIENINKLGKHAWLAPDPTPAAIEQAGYSTTTVVEYRRAILSFNTKIAFSLALQNYDALRAADR